MIEILLYAQKILEDNQIKYWIDCGSLLHLYRDGYLPKDDIDFCLLYNEYDKVKEILLKHSSEFDFIHFRSKEITIKYKGIKCDFIFGEIKEENFYLYSYKQNPYSKNKWNWEWRIIFPKSVYFPLQKLTFQNGLTFPVPYNIEEKLKIHYGDDWKTPKLVPCWTYELNPAKDKHYVPIAVVMTTIGRDDMLLKILPSYLQYPIKLYLADQNEKITPEKEEYYNKLRKQGHYIIHTDYDIGLSKARNILLDQVDQEFVFMTEDDIELKENPYKFLNLFDNYNNKNNLGILGGLLIRGEKEQHYEYELKLENQILSYIKSDKIDLVLNFFLAKSSVFKDIRYDNNLLLCEHTDFFLRLKQLNKWSITYTSQLIGNHYNYKQNENYLKLRTRASQIYAQKFRDKWNLQEVYKDGKLEWKR